MPFLCHAVPLRVEIVSFPFDLHSAAVSDSDLSCHVHAAHMPCSDRAVLLKATAKHVRPETACELPARVRLLPATTRSSTKVVIRSIPTSDAGGQCETKQLLSWARKRVVAKHYKTDDLFNCWISSSDISGYHADFHEGHGTIGAWHVLSMLCVIPPLVLHVNFTSFESCIVTHICNKNQQSAH